jgi:hypothetical protein
MSKFNNLQFIFKKSLTENRWLSVFKKKILFKNALFNTQ